MPARRLNVSALQFLILAMNKEQELFQFEFYNFRPAENDFLRFLDSGGYDLFTTKGRQETPREAFLAALRQEGAKQVVTVIGALVLAALVLILGFKAGG